MKVIPRVMTWVAESVTKRGKGKKRKARGQKAHVFLLLVTSLTTHPAPKIPVHLKLLL